MKRRFDTYWATGEKGSNKKLITFVKNRLVYDKKYAINCDKIKNELGWSRKFNFEEGLDTTIKWYMDNQGWVDRVRS